MNKLNKNYLNVRLRERVRGIYSGSICSVILGINKLFAKRFNVNRSHKLMCFLIKINFQNSFHSALFNSDITQWKKE